MNSIVARECPKCGNILTCTQRRCPNCERKGFPPFFPRPGFQI